MTKLDTLPVLRRGRELKRFRVVGRDGEIGRIERVYFDTQTWAVRYLGVRIGSWLLGHNALLPPAVVEGINDQDHCVFVATTREKADHSPPVDTERPLNRGHERDFFDFYGWSPYWQQGAPVESASAGNESSSERNENAEVRVLDSHVIHGFHVRATDMEVGHVEDLVVDDHEWFVRYLEIDTRNWFPGKKVLLAPAWIGEMDWDHQGVITDLPGEALRRAPAYDPSQVISREYEVRLYQHYGRRQYWHSQS